MLSVSQDAISRDKPQEKANDKTVVGADNASSEPKGQELYYAARISLDRTQMQIDDNLVNLGMGMAVTVEVKTGERSMLSYAENSDHSGGTLSVGDGTHMANIALLGSYMASTFAASSDGHGGTLISEAAPTSTQTPIVTQPHA